MNIPISKKIIVKKTSEKIRLDAFLARKFVETPRKFFQQAIKNEEIEVNGKMILPSYKLKENDEISFNDTFSVFQPIQIKLEPDSTINFNVIFQNEDFAIIEKPAGISTHPSPKGPCGTLVNGLLHKFPKIRNVGEDPNRPGIVHRLDKYTSGLLIIALSQGAFEFFKKSFQDRKIEKNYLAVCWGKFNKKEGEIESFIGKSKTSPTKQSASNNQEKLINPKTAQTFFQVLEENKNKSLLLLSPSTGRKHQIRIHMHSIGHPLVGDILYENKLVKANNRKFSRFFLHASKLSFVDQKGVRHSFTSQLPDEFATLLE